MLRASVGWDNAERTIIYIEASERSDGLDNLETVLRLEEMAESVNHTVNVILYVEAMHYVRPNYVENFETMAEKLHPRIGCFAIVSPDSFFKDLLSIVAQQSSQLRRPLFFAESIEQARQKIKINCADE